MRVGPNRSPEKQSPILFPFSTNEIEKGTANATECFAAFYSINFEHGQLSIVASRRNQFFEFLHVCMAWMKIWLSAIWSHALESQTQRPVLSCRFLQERSESDFTISLQRERSEFEDTVQFPSKEKTCVRKGTFIYCHYGNHTSFPCSSYKLLSFTLPKLCQKKSTNTVFSHRLHRTVTNHAQSQHLFYVESDNTLCVPLSELERIAHAQLRYLLGLVLVPLVEWWVDHPCWTSWQHTWKWCWRWWLSLCCCIKATRGGQIKWERVGCHKTMSCGKNSHEASRRPRSYCQETIPVMLMVPGFVLSWARNELIRAILLVEMTDVERGFFGKTWIDLLVPHLGLAVKFVLLHRPLRYTHTDFPAVSTAHVATASSHGYVKQVLGCSGVVEVGLGCGSAVNFGVHFLFVSDT